MHLLFQYMRWLWESVVVPYVMLSMATLASDGVEAVMHLRETLYVIGCFLIGRSHRSFPVSRSVLQTQRSTTTTAAAAAAGKLPPQTAAGSKELQRAVSEAASSDGREVAAPPLIQRRLLLGKKGEVEEWGNSISARPLVPHAYPLCLSRSLHHLVSIVIGPIQQPTVSTMPTRHPEPQWPPHFMRAGSGGGEGEGEPLGDPSTDDYSSSASTTMMLQPRQRRSAAQYRQASSVVYQRVSARQLDFSSSRVPPHLIASITAHHVLSYPATRQKVLVMDLDETLCYVSTSTANMAGPPSFSEVIPTASGAELFHVWERPHARLFLSTAAKLFNLALFTSASKPYADTILQRIDPDRTLKLRYYRHDCRVVPRGVLRKTCESAASPSGGGPSGGAAGSGNASGSATATGHGSGHSSSSSSSSSGQGPHRAEAALRHTTNWGDSGVEDSAPEGARHNSAGLDPSFDATSPQLQLPTHAAPLSTSTFAAYQPSRMNEEAKVLVKDLRVLKVPLELLVLIDNSEECTLLNPENALIVPPYIPSLSKTEGSLNKRSGVTAGGTATAHASKPSEERDEAATSPANESLTSNDIVPADTEEEDEVLLALLPLLECLLVVPDVRSILRLGRLY